jgi:alpha-1,2-mannosyltransferase
VATSDQQTADGKTQTQAVLAFVALGLAAMLFADAVLNAQQVFADWHAYYRAAANLLAGAGIYAEGMALVARNSYDYWVHTDGQYVYPPLLALLLTPLAARLDIGKAGDVWLVVLSLATAGFLGIQARLLDRPLRPEGLAPLGLVTLASVPLLLGIRYGQVDVVLLLVLTLALLAHVRRRDLLAGLALGTAAAVKPTLALYGLYYLRKRAWATLAAAALAGLALGLAPFALLGPAALGEWLTIARYFSGADYPAYPSNQSARGLLLRAFAGGPRHQPLLAAPLLADVLWAAVVLAALALWWRCVSGRREPGRRAAAEYALTGALILLAAPLSEDIHYVLLLPALAVLIDRATGAGRAAPAAWTALAVAACLYFLQPWLDFAYNRGGTDARRLVASGAYLYGLVLTIAALAPLVWRPPGPPARDAPITIAARAQRSPGARGEHAEGRAGGDDAR